MVWRVSYHSPTTSIPLKVRYQLAIAYMEQYGEYVGNFLLGALQEAMDSRDQGKAADWMAISECVDELNGGRTIIQRDPPDGKTFVQ